MKKLLLLILIILPCVVFAQNKSKKKVIKTKHGTITEWSEDGGLFRHYSKDYVTVIGGDDGDDYGSSEPRTNTQTSEQSSSKSDYNPVHPVTKDCKCRGKAMKGKVRVVESNADFKVKVVESNPDIKIKTVNTYPDECGEWQFVNAYPDFTIEYVNAYPDFTIKFVNCYPGVD